MNIGWLSQWPVVIGEKFDFGFCLGAWDKHIQTEFLSKFAISKVALVKYCYLTSPELPDVCRIHSK